MKTTQPSRGRPAGGAGRGPEAIVVARVARLLLGVSALLCALTIAASAQGRGGGAPPAPPPRGQAGALFDLTGTWVSVVNEDWRWRMVTPPKGDYPGLPLNAEARRVADSWDPSKDGLCEAYGAAGVMRMPARLNIAWENPTTLKIDIDAGQQTRRLVFDTTQKPAGPPTLQGHSIAEWERAGGRGGRGGAPGAAGGDSPRGSLKVTTTSMRAGWLRRNGVPYSENATMTEYFDRFAAPDGSEWFVVTSIVSDPTYLTGNLITSTHFRKEPDASKFSPRPCRTG